MRLARPIVLNLESRRQLERQARGRTVPMRVALRSRIVLLAADGKQHKQISEELKISPRMAALWRGRFLLQGVEGLLKDAPRPGRTPSIPAAMVNTVIKKTTQSTPVNATHWSTRTMAREVGISEASVRRIWHAHGLKPHLVKTFKVSRDPEFAGKLEAIVGLYLNPPEHALVCASMKRARYKPWTEPNPGCH
jgi:transposase